MKKTCATCRLSVNGFPGKCDSRRCLSGNFSGWRPPLATTPSPEPQTPSTDEIMGRSGDTIVTDEIGCGTPRDLCRMCLNGPTACEESNKCVRGSLFKALPIRLPEKDFSEVDLSTIQITEPDTPEEIRVVPPEFVYKSDSGKTDMSLLLYFPKALEAICKASEAGCVKYVRGSFKDVPNARRRYTAAMLRHFLAEGEDEPEIDEETGLYHDIHTAWNAVCRLELRLRGLPLD